MSRPNHYEQRIRIARRAAALARQIDALVVEAEGIIAAAACGERAEAEDGGSYSGGWQSLTSDFAANTLSRSAADLRRSAASAGLDDSRELARTKP